MTPTRAVTPRPALARRLFLGRTLAALAGALLPWRVGRARADDQGLATYLGEIKLFACTFAPRNWALCNGQLLPIAQNQALFALLGTQYGGNGQTNFALTDLRGRVAIHHGQGPGLSAYSIGQMAGEENHTLTPGELPAHSHVARASSTVGTSASPITLLPARNAAEVPQYAASPDTTLAAGAISSVGGSQAHPNMQPHLALNYCIALSGIFPTP